MVLTEEVVNALSRLRRNDSRRPPWPLPVGLRRRTQSQESLFGIECAGRQSEFDTEIPIRPFHSYLFSGAPIGIDSLPRSGVCGGLRRAADFARAASDPHGVCEGGGICDCARVIHGDPVGKRALATAQC